MSLKIKNIMDCLDRKSDLIQTICSILSTVLSIGFIGVVGLVLSKQANKISEEQFFFSSQPYFTIFEVDTGGLPTYQICNEGGYIQNATLELGNMLKIDIYKDKIFTKTIFVPFGTNIKELYNIKSESFTISNPKYVMEASEMENRLTSYYLETDYDFQVYSFQYIEIDYVDCNHVFQSDTYLIGSKHNENETETFLALCKDDLKQSILENIPDDYKSNYIQVFPQDVLDGINMPGGRGGATRTFTDDAEQEFDLLIEQIEKQFGSLSVQ